MPRTNDKKKGFPPYLKAGLLALLVLWLLVMVYGIYRKEEVARRAVEETNAQLESLRVREAALSKDLAELATERGREATVRETYGVARPGEEVIIVVPTEAATSTPPLPWWRRALGRFGIWW